MIIIKSGSRTTASFSQLLHYMNNGRVDGDEYFFRHNVYSTKPYNITREFTQNHKLLKRRKNGVALYHEYISLKYQQGYSKEELREILIDLTEQYIKARANNCLVYSVIHEQHNQIHSHLMISGNEIESKKAHYFSQAEFEEIKDRTREYAYEKYPKLERDELEKTKNKTNEKTKGEDRTRDNTKRKAKSIDSEIHLKKRTGKQSEREKTRERLRTIFKLSQSYEEFIKNLRMEKLEIYSRGQTYGFQDTLTGKKYRLKTLELEEEFSQMTHIFENKASKHQEQKLQGTKKHQKENKQQRQSKEQEQNQQQKKKENLGTHEKIKKSDEDKEIKKDNFAKRFFRKRIKEAQKANTKTKEKDNDFSKE